MSESNVETRNRRQLSAEAKATILRRHLADQVPISKLCEEYQIQPSLSYLWQRQALENPWAALQKGRTGGAAKATERGCSDYGTRGQAGQEGRRHRRRRQNVSPTGPARVFVLQASG